MSLANGSNRLACASSVLLVGLFGATSGCGSSASPPIAQHAPWYSPQEAGPKLFAVRDKSIVRLEPSGVTFRLPDEWIAWHTRFKNNLHLSRPELDLVARGGGDWDTEFASVCNAVFPFDRCCAHIGGEGWGNAGVGFGDLQVRVYHLREPVDAVRRRIDHEGQVEAARFDKSPGLAQSQDGAWWSDTLWYGVWYGDYGGEGRINIRTRALGGGTLAFVFMYVSGCNKPEEIDEILSSIRFPTEEPDKGSDS